LGTFGGVCCSRATAINNAGQVAGYTPPASIGNHAFLYTGGVKHDLGALGGLSSLAYGINASGDVVGWSDLAANLGGYHAFLYSGGVMRDLGTLGGVSSQASAVNDSGVVVGISQIKDGSWDGFIYSNGAMQDIGHGSPVAINGQGQIAVEALVPNGPDAGQSHAFLYANGVMTDIGPSHSLSYVRGINASGQIVGVECPPGQWTNCGRAFLYTPANGIIDMNSLLPPNSGWVLTDAAAISDAGQIVGSGAYLGQSTAFLLTLGGGPPVTTAMISGLTGNNGWYLGTTSITLTANGRGSSVATTYFSIDGGSYQVYGGPFPIAGDGTHQISYYSVATTGSREAALQKTISIDATKPFSHVAALPATASAASFSVSWSGFDSLSGIATYTIFSSDNGGAFVPWISGTTATQATYIGVAGHTYRFYSIATDAAGNQEPAKTSPEAATAVPARLKNGIAIQSITGIPLPPGAAFFAASAINASGDVVGSLYSSGFGARHAAVYSHGVITDLGTLGGSNSDAYAINDAGQIAGGTDTAQIWNGYRTYHAFLYTGGVMRDLGDLGGGYSWAYGINASGQVVGESAITDITGAAFLYSGGVMRSLGTLGGWDSTATAINDAGDVVGYSVLPSTVDNLWQAFLYSNGAMQGFGVLHPVSTGSAAYGINASGQITGTVWLPNLPNGNGSAHAFLYANGVMTDLITASYEATYGNGINASGQIVGWGYAPDVGHDQAFVYMPANGIVDLNSLLPQNSGWVLEEARAINNAGQIVGTGKYQGQSSSFLLKIGIIGDVNGDGTVNCADVSIVKASIGKKTGQPGFDPRADVNNDGVIDVRDLAIVTQALAPGTTCP
jgi:probable HAF family extracellular repeat protein